MHSNRFHFIFILALGLCSCNDQGVSQNMAAVNEMFYPNSDLGLSFETNRIVLKVWSPESTAMMCRIYHDPTADVEALATLPMSLGDFGAWMTEIPVQYRGQFYTVQAEFKTGWRSEVPDPYAKAVGTNGLRGQLIDPSAINPSGWESDAASPLRSIGDAVIYEVHVRDFSIHPTSGMVNKGRYLAFTETGLKDRQGNSVGIDHLVELGVTHVHLLPVFDFLSIDESKPEIPQYNWGYDPQNYFVPEGSYATDASNSTVRIKEFKEMVQALHKAELRVVMDVVYNHTGRVDGLSLEETAPGQYYRQWPDGKYSDASACGNETASDKPMFRKLMMESLLYWTKEYHIDGFRFDLMAIHDQTTMQVIADTLLAARSDLLIYGEGWTASDSPLPEGERALKKYTYKMPGVAAFSDDMRDGIKGHWSDHNAKGFISGKWDLRESVKFGIVGATAHPDIDYTKINNSDTAWASSPLQCINYVSCHDNHTLFDKLELTNPQANESTRKNLQILANALVLTSQGIPFIHAGAEMMRTKQGMENSYKSPDSVNAIDWGRKAEYLDVFKQYRWFIGLRKSHPCFRLGSTEEIQRRLHFLESADSLLIYQIDCPAEDEWNQTLVICNAANVTQDFSLPEGLWTVAYLGIPAEKQVIKEGTVQIPAHSLAIFFQKLN